MKRTAPLCVLAFSMLGACTDYATPVQAQTGYAYGEDPAGGEVQGPVAGSIPDIPGAPGERVDENTIRNALVGYGEWQSDPTYGYVWYPSPTYVGSDFVPYGTAGHWVQTDAGFYWQSDYPFGWLTFHYGRWIRSGEGLWAWVPGRLFAPAWVDWRENDSYVGWAPLPPDGVVMTDWPYAFCAMDAMFAIDLWTRVLYGPPAMNIYPTTVAVPPAYGIGGAVYAWGPHHVATPVNPNGAPAVVPIATAWHSETSPRAGSMMGAASGSGARPVGPVMNAPASPSSVPGHAPIVASAPAIIGPSSASFHVPVAPSPTSVPPGIANYATNPPVPRNLSIGTTPPGVEAHVTVPTTIASTPSYTAPVYHPTYAAPANPVPAYAPAYHPTYTAPTYVAPVYHPSYSAPSYSAPAYHPSYSAPVYHPTYSAPAYHPSYSAPAYHPSYSAPAYHPTYSAPSYHPSFSFGGRR